MGIFLANNRTDSRATATGNPINYLRCPLFLQKEEEEQRVTWKEDCALSTMQNASSGKTSMKVGLADLGEVAVDSIREAQQRIEAMQFLPENVDRVKEFVGEDCSSKHAEGYQGQVKVQGCAWQIRRQGRSQGTNAEEEQAKAGELC